MKYKNIVVSGDVGTGTTTLAKGLAKKLGWKYLAAGDVFRDYAKKKKIQLWNKEAVPDQFERKVDREMVEKLISENGYVLDGHYTGWFARNLAYVFRILLTCERKIATDRMLARDHTHKENVEDIEKRRSGLYAKFKKLYSTDNYEDPKYFHLIIDTASQNAAETLSMALKKVSSPG